MLCKKNERCILSRRCKEGTGWEFWDCESKARGANLYCVVLCCVGYTIIKQIHACKKLTKIMGFWCGTHGWADCSLYSNWVFHIRTNPGMRNFIFCGPHWNSLVDCPVAACLEMKVKVHYFIIHCIFSNCWGYIGINLFNLFSYLMFLF